MSARRNIVLLMAVAVLGSQAGHLVAYALRFGAAAPGMQAAGAHSYFPSLARLGLGVAALAILAALFVIGAGRVLAGRRLDTRAMPSLIRVLAGLFSMQLVLFVLQETAEGLVGGGRLSSAPALLLWGAAGQLPVAVVAALALRWLLARVGPALAAIRSRKVLTPHRHVLTFAVRTLTPAPQFARRQATTFSLTRRGPPPSF